MWMGVLSKQFEENVEINNFLSLEFKEITSRGIDKKGTNKETWGQL